MRLLFLFIVLFFPSNTVFAQLPSKIVEYTLRHKGNIELTCSNHTLDSAVLDTFLQAHISEGDTVIKIELAGTTTNRLIEIIKREGQPATGIVTSYTYSILKKRPERDDRQLFPEKKIVEKEVWELVYRRACLDYLLADSLFKIISPIYFDSLPNYKEPVKEMGGHPLHGVYYQLTIAAKGFIQKYGSSFSAIEKSKQLISLLPAVNLVWEEVATNEELKINYKPGYCYNSRTTHIFTCVWGE